MGKENDETLQNTSPNDMMPNMQELMGKSQELNGKLATVLYEFCQKNTKQPAQLVIASIADLLVQFSTAHIGPAMTIEFLAELQSVVKEGLVHDGKQTFQ